VPIRLVLQNNHSFAPEEIAVIVAAFEDTLRALNLVNREDPLASEVAKLFELAKQGERGPVRLRGGPVKIIAKIYPVRRRIFFALVLAPARVSTCASLLRMQISPGTFAAKGH
jgi:hypothetical protein